ncbi:GGDEF domain-containing protein [Bradyrhizobium erythrophlei]|uniref:GGDEF domain-containing protein n=1 Tax=Bradyrhizobium erythrophlei TaxID=1437360 RepID=UPI0035E5D1AF
MNKLRPFFHLKSSRHVLVMLALITSLSVAAPVLSIATALTFMPKLPGQLYWGVISLSAIIPLLIAPPIALGGLSILRLLTITIDRLDNYVRYDALTGVLSRVYLLGQMREILAKGGSFLMIDADHFKSINDTYGHDVGDEALKCLSEVLKTFAPNHALVGRLGGEEFGVFLPEMTSLEAGRVADNLCAAMRRSGEVIAGHRISLTISIGVAQHRPDSTLEQTLKLADEALYHAKRTGRDRYHVATASAALQAAKTGSIHGGQDRRSRHPATQLAQVGMSARSIPHATSRLNA